MPIYDYTKREFFVTLPELAGMKIFMEVKRAFGLYWWAIARVTREYRHKGNRVGAVLGLCPVTDQRIADDVSRYGKRCSATQVRHWRRALERRGLIACLRTPAGHRIMVPGSDKFKDEPGNELPAWAANIVESSALWLETASAESCHGEREHRSELLPTEMASG